MSGCDDVLGSFYVECTWSDCDFTGVVDVVEYRDTLFWVCPVCDNYHADDCYFEDWGE